MLRFLADHNFDDRIILAMLEQEPALDLVRARDAALSRSEDPLLLEWATNEGRVLLTHDVNSMPGFAFERLRDGKLHAGVMLVRKTSASARIVEDLTIIALAGTEADVGGQVLNIPFTR
jgi:hypothetical protein